MNAPRLCAGAGLRICNSCYRDAERHPAAAASPHHPWVGATTTDRCPRWLAVPPQAQVSGQGGGVEAH